VQPYTLVELRREEEAAKAAAAARAAAEALIFANSEAAAEEGVSSDLRRYRTSTSLANSVNRSSEDSIGVDGVEMNENRA
jgi:hypothetical protein